MNIVFTVTNDKNADFKSLYKRLREFGLNVTDMGKFCYVHGVIMNSEKEDVLKICKRFGKVNAADDEMIN